MGAHQFLVGGGILMHNIPALHHLVEHAGLLVRTLADLMAGVVAGALVLGAVTVSKRLLHRR